jgi:hypothetical protein
MKCGAEFLTPPVDNQSGTGLDDLVVILHGPFSILLLRVNAPRHGSPIFSEIGAAGTFRRDVAHCVRRTPHLSVR